MAGDHALLEIELVGEPRQDYQRFKVIDEICHTDGGSVPSFMDSVLEEAEFPEKVRDLVLYATVEHNPDQVPLIDTAEPATALRLSAEIERVISDHPELLQHTLRCDLNSRSESYDPRHEDLNVKQLLDLLKQGWERGNYMTTLYLT